MSLSQEEFAELREQVLSNNMMDVLNAMCAIGESGNPRGMKLLKIAGQNVSGLAKNMKLQLPGGPLTFEEFRQQQMAKLGGQPVSQTCTAADREIQDRLDQFKRFAVRASATFIIDDALDLCRKLIEARNQQLTASPEEIYRNLKGWPSIRRAEDADPTGAFGGQFAYFTQKIDDPECRSLLSRVDRRMRVELSDRLYDMKRIRSFWMSEVRPQQFAFYRLDLLHRFEAVPTDGWSVGPV